MTNIEHEMNTMNKLEYFHPGHGISNIWSPDGGRSWSWANRNGEGSNEVSFDAAVDAAEAALAAEADYKHRGVDCVYSEACHE